MLLASNPETGALSGETIVTKGPKEYDYTLHLYFKVFYSDVSLII